MEPPGDTRAFNTFSERGGGTHVLRATIGMSKAHVKDGEERTRGGKYERNEIGHSEK